MMKAPVKRIVEIEGARATLYVAYRGEMKPIYFDAEDAPVVDRYLWYILKRSSPVREVYYVSGHEKGTPGASRRRVYMHRLIMGARPGSEIDHRDGNGLNNTKSNLRFCTHSQNKANTHVASGVSRYKGVTWDKSRGVWQAWISVGDRTKWLGRFATEAEAASAYNTAAVHHYGEFAHLNEVA
jgi:hypothetical protein